MVKAIIVGLLVSLCASLLGVSLVLKRYSMIGEGLSNVGFGALAVALAFNLAPLKVSIPVVVLAAFLLLKVSESSKIKGDAAIAIISTASLAGGVMIVSLTTGISIDVCNFMFGSILAMSNSDVNLSIALSLVVIALFVIFYNKIFAVTFDEIFAKATGTRSDIYNMLIALLTAITIVLGMRMMGALLISSLIIFPALSSMRVFKRFKTVVISSAVISAFCFIIGITISYKLATPAGASVVMIDLLVFLICFIVGKMRGVKMKKILMTSMLLLIILSLAGCAKNETGEMTSETAPAPTADAGSTFVQSPAKPQPGYVEDDEVGENELYIREKMFITQINDIYFNIADYDGKTIVVEGMFQMIPGMDGNEAVPAVYRVGPGCCGNDGWAGFLLNYDGDLPEVDSWIRVKGTPELIQNDVYVNLYLNVTEMEVKELRGAEFVEQ